MSAASRAGVALRSALYLAILAVVTPFYAAAVLLMAPLPRVPRWIFISWWPRSATILARWLLGIDYEVIGRERIPAEPVVILAKHQSTWETFAFSGIFPPHVYVLKRELLWIPFFGWGLALFSPIAIDRSNRSGAMRRTIELGKERFAQGFSIMIYPEGTRVAVGRRGTYRTGGANLATHLGAKVLPVAHNAGLVWPRNSFLKYPGKVTVIIGEPIDTAGMKPADLMRRVETWIETEVAGLVRRAEHAH